VQGYGVQFLLTRETHQALKKAVHALDLMDTPRRPEKDDWAESLGEWMRVLFSTGRGWVPEIPAAPAPRTGPAGGEGRLAPVAQLKQDRRRKRKDLPKRAA
jgi:hypothetical protein